MVTQPLICSTRQRRWTVRSLGTWEVQVRAADRVPRGGEIRVKSKEELWDCACS